MWPRPCSWLPAPTRKNINLGFHLFCPPPLLLSVPGHSLGGALATFFAYDIARLLPTRSIVMYNFAEADPGDQRAG